MTLMFNSKPKGVEPYACYHWWGHAREPHPYANLRTPIILSIATLRAVNPTIPIVILDGSRKSNDWAHFQKKFNLLIIPIECQLTKYKNLVEGWQYLSRIYDLNHYLGHSSINIDTIMYVDSDVFWLKNPLPFDTSPERFVFDGWNTGFFYYDRYSRSNEVWFDIFDSYTRAAIYSDDVRAIMKKYLGYEGWYGVWDEMILTYMAHEHSNLFNITNVNEHSTTRVLQYADKDKVKMFHCNGTMVANPITGDKHARGLMCLLVKEFYDNLKLVLDQNEIDMMFTQDEQAYCVKHRFSLFNDLNKLLSTKDEMGLYHTEKMLN
jgi:hypothetical protein